MQNIHEFEFSTDVRTRDGMMTNWDEKRSLITHNVNVSFKIYCRCGTDERVQS